MILKKQLRTLVISLPAMLRKNRQKHYWQEPTCTTRI